MAGKQAKLSAARHAELKAAKKLAKQNGAQSTYQSKAKEKFNPQNKKPRYEFVEKDDTTRFVTDFS